MAVPGAARLSHSEFQQASRCAWQIGRRSAFGLSGCSGSSILALSQLTEAFQGEHIQASNVSLTPHPSPDIGVADVQLIAEPGVRETDHIY